ncbi:hypothetical protein NMS_1272 [Nonlabens marinus S1-08]|uniref:Uncharacterized protein n=1 Tax=Nonlabens marinus S1-08 TaxID=1454201 RepID=W8VZW4_9FLAO|nr:hypothetical protein NMS_1272 [Nonlabens marinus S1-08]
MEEAVFKANQRFENLDKAVVDVYPQFKGCDEMEKTPDCFYQKLHALIKQRLTQDTLTMQIKQMDSLVTAFTVTEKGIVRYDSIVDSAQHIDRVFLDSILRVKLKDLPSIDSALKQGIPVSSSYLVPVVVKPISEKAYQ